MIKFPPRIFRALAMCAGLLVLFSLPLASANAAAPDLTNSVWNWAGENISLVLTFTQGKPEQKGLAAILKGWGDAPVELHGEYSENGPEPHLRITGIYEGEEVAFNLKFNPGDHEQQPYLDGEFSVGSKVFPIFAGCEKQCPDVSSKKASELEIASLGSKANDLAGEWRDDSESIGFKEHWSINFTNGQWQISGEFIKGEEVVGSFHGEEIVFDRNQGVLKFLQFFDQKPDENWLTSNELEVTAKGDTLKFKVRGVEAILTRAPGSKK